MNPTLIAYLGFVVAALILIWAVFEISRRLTRTRKPDPRSLDSWVKIDSTHLSAPDELLPPATGERDEDDDTGDIAESNLHTRAKQNGHYSESKKPL